MNRLGIMGSAYGSQVQMLEQAEVGVQHSRIATMRIAAGDATVTSGLGRSQVGRHDVDACSMLMTRKG